MPWTFHEASPFFSSTLNFTPITLCDFVSSKTRLRVETSSSVQKVPTHYSMDLNSSPSSSPIPVVWTTAPHFEGTSPPPPNGDAASSLRRPINLWPGIYHSPVTNALWEARSKIFERLFDPPKDAPPQSELLTRTPSQSRTTIIYGFSSDSVLKEQYRDPWSEIRIGKLLEDLDALAGTISVKHCSDEDNTTRPLLLVTASVDRIVLKKPISVDIDLKIVGSVIWVGRSSIEIQLEVIQSTEDSSDGSDPVALTANFIFVARDSKTGKSAPVNRLSPETEQEKFLYEKAEARNELRKRKREVDKRELQNGNLHRLETLLTEGRIFCDMPALADRDSILLRDTRLENSLICQPQQRNIHGRIFGGFLMHLAFELAFSTAYVFAGLVPCFLEVDHVDFLKPNAVLVITTYCYNENAFVDLPGNESGDDPQPDQCSKTFNTDPVDVGDFLRLKSCVLYTELDNPDEPLINVEVVAHVSRPEMRSSEVSNTFYFTFTLRQESKVMRNGWRIRKVVPETEEEAHRILERMDAEALLRH